MMLKSIGNRTCPIQIFMPKYFSNSSDTHISDNDFQLFFAFMNRVEVFNDARQLFLLHIIPQSIFFYQKIKIKITK